MRFAFANHDAVRLEKTQDFFRIPSVAAQNARLSLSAHLFHERQVVPQAGLLFEHLQEALRSGDSLPRAQFLDDTVGLRSDPPSQSDELFVTFLQLLMGALAQAFGGPADLQHPALGGSAVIDDFEWAPWHPLARRCRDRVSTRNESASERAVGGMMNVGFDRGGIGAKLFAKSNLCGLGLLDHALVDEFGAFAAKKSEGARETGKIGNGILKETGKAPIEQTGAQFAFELPKGKSFEMLEDHAAQEPVWSNAFASALSGARAAGREGLSAQSEQLRVIQEAIDPLEERVVDGSGFFEEGKGEE